MAFVLVRRFIKNDKEGFKPYWVNTSSNDLIKMVLARAESELKTELEDLIKGKEIEKVVNENIVMHEIETDADNAWSFLLFSGYLRISSILFKLEL